MTAPKPRAPVRRTVGTPTWAQLLMAQLLMDRHTREVAAHANWSHRCLACDLWAELT